MSDQNEVERIKRLRERQLAARDPTTKEKQMQREIATKYRRVKSEEKLVKDSWEVLSTTLKGTIIGTILGVITMVAVPFIIEGRTGAILGLACLPAMIVLGAFFGSLFHWRSQMRNIMK